MTEFEIITNEQLKIEEQGADMVSRLNEIIMSGDYPVGMGFIYFPNERGQKAVMCYTFDDPETLDFAERQKYNNWKLI